jgi:hypothetical protein
VKHYLMEEKVQKTRLDKELSTSSLQALDDLKATYRENNKKHYKGYVANFTETCDLDKHHQLVTKVQGAANRVNDAK